MTRPTVSIIVPIYNHACFIKSALRSIADQSYRPLEVIIIDDGSSDGSDAVASQYIQDMMPQAKFLARGNCGAANTINEGILLSSGEFINILNSDDEFNPLRIEQCIDAALRFKRDMIYTRVEFIDEIGNAAENDDYIAALDEAQKTLRDYPTLGFALMKNQLAISSGNLFFSRKLFEQIGGFYPYKYIHDWDFLLRSVFFQEPYVIDQCLYKYRFHGKNSFKSLDHVVGYETTEVMRNFIWSMIARLPLNHRAPSPHYWPVVFDRVIEKLSYHMYLPPKFRN